MSELFRSEAVNAKKIQWMGEILLARPLSFAILTTVATIIFLITCIFIVATDYTRKERVTGSINPAQGVAKVYPPSVGRIVARHVREGQIVKRGDMLFTISTERVTSSGNTQIRIGEQITQRRFILKNQLEAQRNIQIEGDAALRNKLEDVRAQQATLRTEIELQKQRVSLSEKALARFTELSADKFVSAAQLSDRQQDQLDQSGRLMTLQRSLQNLTGEVRSLESSLRNAPRTALSQIANIEREIAQLNQESLLNEAQGQLVIAAPRDGRASSILGEVGQTVSPNQPLMSVLAPSDQIEAHLYVPSRAVGFLHAGLPVKIRYDAFPYQKFGLHDGQIETISATALSPDELQLLDRPPEMLYRVKVALKSPEIIAYGKKYRLQEGMKLEADILLDTRRLYEWILEPLYSLTGRL